jgi:hypothetical protein
VRDGEEGGAQQGSLVPGEGGLLLSQLPLPRLYYAICRVCSSACPSVCPCALRACGQTPPHHASTFEGGLGVPFVYTRTPLISSSDQRPTLTPTHDELAFNKKSLKYSPAL